jgi:phasin
MDLNTQIKATKATEFSGTDAPRAFREMAEKGTTQANETYEKINAATTEAADLIKNSYSTAARGMQEYNKKVIEFAHANTNGAFDFVQKVSGVKSPPAFIELWTEHVRKQVETLVEQTKQLAAIAQKMMRATQPGRPS